LQVLLPDANRKHALDGIVGAFAGAAGQRCMALSACESCSPFGKFRLMVVITVGESSSWVPELVERASKLKVGSGFDPSTNVYVFEVKV
jgi:malonate-semialdehyde dehydrogenase (acetylating)/methylmalonate-semialdehyde dehydrogenase